ncbi:MAG: diguanylate cyclase [Atopobiaceae bacterium]|nr:diguanylate cyclase [Atopobiaceae bacterium]
MRHRTHPTSIRTRIYLAMIVCVAVVVSTFAISSSYLFRRYEVEDCVEYAYGLCGLVSDEIDPELVNDYLARGYEAPGYGAIRDRLYELRAAYPDVEYLYVYQIQQDGCHVVFDLDTDAVPANEPGEVVEFDPSFLPHLDALLAGENVEPVISNDKYGYLLTVYAPLYDKSGACVCYVAVDFLMGEINEYVEQVMLSVVTVSAVFLLLLAVVGFALARQRIVRPLARMEDQAYRDGLTGVQNKAAYEERAHALSSAIEEGKAVFAILMIDINFLKRVNDTYGHEKGDAYLRKSCDLMCSVFGKDRVYRYGGDEFVVVLENGELVEATSLLYDFREAVGLQLADESLAEWERVSAAAGMAVYDPKTDATVQDVLERADQDMYEHKRAMRAERAD